MTNPTGKGGFVKGDPRINRKGRPKSFDALRTLAQQIAHEEAQNKNGEALVISGHKVTVAEAVLRSWFKSSNPQLVKSAMEIAFGKVPNAVEITGKDGAPLIPARAEKALKKVYGSE